MAMIARVFGCAACEGRGLARWELGAGVSGVVNAADGHSGAAYGHECKIVGCWIKKGFGSKLLGGRIAWIDAGLLKKAPKGRRGL